MNKKRCKALLPLVQLLPAVAAAAAVLFALPRTVPVLAAVPERLAAVVEQPVEAAFSEAEEEVLPKLPYADGVYVGSSRGYGGTVRVQVTMENGSITEIGILDASHETKQFLRRAKRLLATVVEAQSWEVDAVSEATYTSRGILGAVQNALTGEVVNNPLPPQPKPAAPLVAEEFTAPSTYLDGIYTAEAIGFEGKITVQITVAEDQITDITLLSAEDEEEYLPGKTGHPRHSGRAESQRGCRFRCHLLLYRHPECGQAGTGKGGCCPGRGSRTGAGSIGRSGRRSRTVRSSKIRGNAGHCAHRGGGASRRKKRRSRMAQRNMAAAFPGRCTGIL